MIGHIAVSKKQAIHSLTPLHSEGYIDNLIASGHSSLASGSPCGPTYLRLFKQSEADEIGNVGTKEPSAYLTTSSKHLAKYLLLISRLYKACTQSIVVESAPTY